MQWGSCAVLVPDLLFAPRFLLVGEPGVALVFGGCYGALSTWVQSLR